MRRKQKLKRSAYTSLIHKGNRTKTGTGRDRLKKTKTVKLSNIRGVVWSALTRLRLRSGTNLNRLVSKPIYELIKCLLAPCWGLDALLQNTLLRATMEKTELVEEATPSEKSYVTNLIYKYLPALKIDQVKKVNNPHLAAMYELVKEEYQSRHKDGPVVQELELFHSTKNSAVESIIRDNLDWRRVTRARFGCGTCFSSDADYANCHANRGNGSSREFIICKVLVCNKILGSACLKIPDQGYDTATGGRTREIIYIKFNDNEFLPKFVVYYNDSNYYSSKYNRMSSTWF